MRDWRRIVESQLPALPLRPEREAEVVDELAQLLEDAYAASGGELSDAEVAEWVRSEVPAWQDLATEIRRAEEPVRSRLPLPHPPPDPARTRRVRQRGTPMNALRNDARFALRMLAKNPGFTAVATLTLALGIGVNAAVFSIVDALLLRPIPVAEPDRLINVYATSPGFTGIASHLPMSFPDYEDLREESETVEELVAYSYNRMVLDDGAEHRIVQSELVTGNYFETLGVGPTLGRTLSRDDDRRGQPILAVVSHRTWQTRFGGDPGVIGETLRLNGRAVTVAGVAAAGFDGLLRGLPTELWLPISSAPALNALGSTTAGDRTEGLAPSADRAYLWVWVFGRLAPGSSVEQAAAEIETQSLGLQKQYPGTNAKRSFVLSRTGETLLVPSLTTMLSGVSAGVMALVGLVLAIVCANLANLLLARALYRRKEIATRLALGASRAMVMRQLLAESLALALLGGGLGLGLAGVTNQLLTSVSFTSLLSFELDLGIDWRVALFTLAVATLTAVAIALAPAFAATRDDLATALHAESRGMAGGLEKRRLRSALVVAQVALALLLLICGGLSLRSMRNAHRVDPGFEPAGLAVARYVPTDRDMTAEQHEEFYRALKLRTEALPGVRSAAFTTNTPLSVLEYSIEFVAAEGHDSAPPEDWPQADTIAVGPGYFETLRLPLAHGRGFDERDTQDSRRLAVVNETLAGTLWPGERPGAVLGKRMRIQGSEEMLEVVGVARDSKYRTLGEPPHPFLYQSLAQLGVGERTLVVRTDGRPQALLATVRRLSRDLDRRMALIDLGTMEQAIRPSLVLPRTSAALFGTFGVIGLLLAATGIYGVIAYMAGQRTHEVGVRMAMGANRGDILRLILRDGVALTAAGVALGLGGALALTRLLSAVLYGVSATDLLTFTAVPIFLGLAAFLASYLPARRASQVDPLAALRYE